MALDDVKQSIEQNLTNAYDKALDKGATEPENKNLENLASTIDSIQGGTTLGYHVRSVINPDGETQTLRIISGENITLQDKTATPSEEAQTITADEGYFAIENMTVEAIPSDYVGSAVQKVTETTYTPTTTDIVIDANQYLDGAQTIKGDANLLEENIAEGVELFGLTGTHKGGTTPILITKEITENRTYNASDDNADGYSSIVVNVASSGGDDVLVFDRVFGNNTPEQISKVAMRISYMTMTAAEVEETYGWKLGDTIDIPLTTGENLKVMIVGFGHDSLTNNGRAGITLQAVNLPFKSKLWSNSTNASGYQATDMYKTFLPEFETKIPQEWLNVIKPVKKVCADGGGSYYKTTISVLCNLFLLSEQEIMGAKTVSVATEGTQYEYWKNHNTNADRIKYYDSDLDGEAETATNWWTRSPYKSSTAGWCIVKSDGTLAYVSTPTYTYGVALAFCV